MDDANFLAIRSYGPFTIQDNPSYKAESPGPPTAMSQHEPAQ